MFKEIVDSLRKIGGAFGTRDAAKGANEMLDKQPHLRRQVSPRDLTRLQIEKMKDDNDPFDW